MEFKIDKIKLLEALNVISGAVEKRQTMAILSNFLLEFYDNTLHMVASDLEVELSIDITPESVESEGSITVPARKFMDITKSLPDDKVVTVNTQDNKLVIRSSRSKFTLQTLASTDYPHVEQGVGSGKLNLPAPMLSHLIDKSQFAMAQQDVRYYLNGLYFEIDGTHLRTVATDGHRLAMSQFQLQDSFDIGVIIPRKGVLELGRLVANRSSDVSIVVGNNHIKAVLSNVTLISKLVDGKYPDYQKVIPKNTDKEILINRKVFKEGLQRAAILSNEKFRGVKLILNNAEGITLLSHNPEQEEAEIFIPATTQSYDLEIGFNVQYLLDVVNSCDEENIMIYLGDINSSALIQGENNPNSIYVVMPMRL